MGAVRVRERPGDPAELRCAACREDLGAPGFACVGCDVRLHAACAGWLGGCPTLGCGGAAPGRPRLRRARRRLTGLARDCGRFLTGPVARWEQLLVAAAVLLVALVAVWAEISGTAPVVDPIF